MFQQQHVFLPVSILVLPNDVLPNINDFVSGLCLCHSLPDAGWDAQFVDCNIFSCCSGSLWAELSTKQHTQNKDRKFSQLKVGTVLDDLALLCYFGV